MPMQIDRDPAGCGREDPREGVGQISAEQVPRQKILRLDVATVGGEQAAVGVNLDALCSAPREKVRPWPFPGVGQITERCCVGKYPELTATVLSNR